MRFRRGPSQSPANKMLVPTIIAILLILLGVCLLINPGGTFKVVMTIVGVMMIVSAIHSFIGSGRIKLPNFRSAFILKAVSSLITGIVMVIASWTQLGPELWSLLMYLISFMLFLTGLGALVELLMYNAYGFKFTLFIEGILMILAAVYFWVKPQNIGFTILVVSGLVSIISGFAIFFGAYNRRYDLPVDTGPHNGGRERY